MADVETVLLLGEAHPRHGRVAHRVLGGGRASAALSAGRSPTPASQAAKFDPNEDAVLVMDAEDACLLAVADGHYGRRASHGLLEGLARVLTPHVATLHELIERLETPGEEAAGPAGPSASTLSVAVYHRRARRGFGISFGDSSVVLLGAEGARFLAEKRARYMTPARLPRRARRDGAPFEFEVPEGDAGGGGGLLVAFTDGVDECCYGRPERSIGASHLAALFERVGPVPSSFVRDLAQLALDGVDGHPGGEDNLAIAATVL
jgi:hypothetical protein